MTRWGRLTVLFVFAAGFFTMHGFLAVSASADTRHHGQQHASATAAVQAASAGADANPVRDRPEPAEHHDLVAGCVVALVGVALAGLALLSLRRRCWSAEDRGGLVPQVVLAIGLSAVRWSPPRVALCVIRV